MSMNKAATVLGELLDLLNGLIEVIQAASKEVAEIKKRLQADSTVDDTASDAVEEKYKA